MSSKTHQLEQLKKLTTVVADSGDFQSIEKFKPIDATTNPSLIYKAAREEKYKHLIEEAIFYSKKNFSKKNFLEAAIDKLFVNFGLEILKIIPGKVSIEVDARYSFDIEKSVEKAKKLIKLFEENNVKKERILIKLAATYEGIQAAKKLQSENINCNLTLIFSIFQAILCAEANVFLISPFVGRILDWHLKNSDKKSFLPSEDPGVLSVKNIYNYYKNFEYPTLIMGASFRNKDQILELAGCDFLTISPELLNNLKRDLLPIKRKLSPSLSKNLKLKKIELDEKSFRYFLNRDAMATEKLAEGIRKFSDDMENLEKMVLSIFDNKKI
jgi:transaldolase